MTRSDIDGILNAWSSDELAPWARRHVGAVAIEAQARVLNDVVGWIFVFDIGPGGVTVRPKPGFYSTSEWTSHDVPECARMIHYRHFISEVLNQHPVERQITLIVDVSDGWDHTHTVPVFSFQKHLGATSVLLPDPDFFYHGFYQAAEFRDTLNYSEKVGKAIFVGSTSGGGIITQAAVDNLTVPRLRAGQRFRGSDIVDFTLPSIVQCENRDVERAIRDLGFGVGKKTWQDQFKYKSIISIDGNGATCSRVAVTLRSNSILLKYDSPHILYYFKGLTPWYHYIPISDDSDVIQATVVQRFNPVDYEPIAHASSRFFEDYLSKPSVILYMAHLLRFYGRYGAIRHVTRMQQTQHHVHHEKTST